MGSLSGTTPSQNRGGGGFHISEPVNTNKCKHSYTQGVRLKKNSCVAQSRTHAAHSGSQRWEGPNHRLEPRPWRPPPHLHLPR